MRIHETNFGELTDEQLYSIHLKSSEPTHTKDYVVVSTLAILNQEVGMASSFNRSRTILPIFGIMAIIEQLGETYITNRIPAYPKNKSNANSLKKGLHYFGGLDENTINILCALRNGIAHNGSFFSKSRAKKSVENYIFYYDDNQAELITKATIPWDGLYTNLSENQFTAINSTLLRKLANDCIENAINDNINGDLSVVLKGGNNELIFRFLKWKTFKSIIEIKKEVSKPLK